MKIANAVRHTVHDPRIHPVPESGCWIWTGGISGPYGSTSYRGATRRAHRVTWEVANGPIPAGMEIDHRCRQTLCVNPDHLQLVTPRVNRLENSNGMGARHLRRTKCEHCGGALTPHPRRPGRWCVPCGKRQRSEMLARTREDSRLLDSRMIAIPGILAHDVDLREAIRNGIRLLAEQGYKPASDYAAAPRPTDPRTPEPK